MRILFTGGSSFTGMWFVQELSKAGHSVVATFQRSGLAEYSGGRKVRVEKVVECSEPIYDCAFGSEVFMEVLMKRGPFDAICHHGADVSNYKSVDFDVVRAVANNTRNIRKVLTEMLRGGCKRFLSTASVFSPNEGAGSENLRGFSPYGLSKGFTNDLIAYHAADLGVSFGKFVIPNPFGPYEEPRFTNYLMKMWYEGKTPEIRTPDYVRDNIHVSLLAKAYGHFLESMPSTRQICSFSPAGYIESQGAFATRFANEMSPRLGIACPVEMAIQSDFSEPRIRVNIDAPDQVALGWDETGAWDELARYYEGIYAPASASA